MKNWKERQLNHQQDTQKNRRRAQLRHELLEWLAMQPDRMALQADFLKKINNPGDADSLMHQGDFIVFEMDGQTWIHSRADHSGEFQNALETYKRDTAAAAWRACLAMCDETVRPGAAAGETCQAQVLARSYTQPAAAKRLGLPLGTIQAAVKAGALAAFSDPEGVTRIPAGPVEALAGDPVQCEEIAGFTVVKIREIALVTELAYGTARGRLIRAGIGTSSPTWGQVRGLWGLPHTYAEFQAIAAERVRAWKLALEAKKEEARQAAVEAERQALRRAREERERLRRQLFELFPSWDGHDRSQQRVSLHLGPTNSGKTFQGISQLVQAGSGWYLAPLRLLAHEVFDTLNKNGTLCNLLTGEQRVDVPGAQITAATIEMFDPRRSGSCVVIDEAHMLSDSQRGWAWTRAIMEATAPEIHIIGAPIVEALIQKMTAEIGLEVEVEHYTRLTPLETADEPWSLASLPERTILVAFSRRMVLSLKTELERNYHRKVSVVYGNLPPEVRLNQAERFARGETEICVATDAIGMGLNLPADNVCFYETQKFDGEGIRTLSVNEIRQIGGRAGRYGLSEKGLIGALNMADLNVIRSAIYTPIEDIQVAHVAPAPEAIQLMPGELSEKLQKWVEMAGIPPRWRELLKPVDLSSQIELARLLSPGDVKRLGEDVALLLINAPCYRDTQDYWLQCARAIIYQREMPLIRNLKKEIQNATDLETYEIAIRCADIYLWLSQREPFAPFAPEQEYVRQNRLEWSLKMDLALQRRVDTSRRVRSYHNRSYWKR